MANQMRSDQISCNGALAKSNCDNAQPIYQTNGVDDQIILTCPDIPNIYSSSSNTARRLVLTYICELNADPYSNVIFEKIGKDGTVPLYYVTMRTRYACLVKQMNQHQYQLG
eukprot:125760_1